MANIATLGSVLENKLHEISQKNGRHLKTLHCLKIRSKFLDLGPLSAKTGYGPEFSGVYIE